MKDQMVLIRSQRLSAPGARFAILVIFLALVFLMGGGSRPDVVSLIVLRPVAAFFAIYAVLLITADQLRSVRTPLALLSALALLIVLQLMPLPPAWWAGLPDREVVRDLYAAIGQEERWFPLALSPARAVNSLFSLIVPLAALLLFAIQAPEQRPRLFLVVLVMTVVSVALGIMQLLGSPNGSLYLYRITNNGLPVGLFSNRNHQALLISIGILLSAFATGRALRRPRVNVAWVIGGFSLLLVFLPFLLIIGSRAGLVLGALMLLPSAFLIYQAARGRRGRSGRSAMSDPRFRAAAAAGLAAVMGVIFAAIWFSRSLAFDRLIDQNVELDLRAQTLPVVLDLTARQFPFGAGFGSFDTIYRQVEPAHLLMPSYLNHAHNDWIQFLLEGGLGALLLLIAALAWFGHVSFRVLWTNRTQLIPELFVCMIIVGVYALSSVVDYPLRTPSLMAVFAICCGMLSALTPVKKVASDRAVL
jgi:O-antigen ligase